jgi:catechol 2,3-dioxygenase-like lactoylglutathione lyase family enzyme
VFDHVTIRVSNHAASERFYDTVLPSLDLEARRAGLYTEWADLSIAEATENQPLTRRLHVAFFAPSHEVVDEFWRIGTEAGYRERRRAGGAPALPPGLLGRLPPRSGREQHRSGRPRARP